MRPLPRARSSVIRATPKRFAACFSESKLVRPFVARIILTYHNHYARSGENGKYWKASYWMDFKSGKKGVLLSPPDYFRRATEITIVVNTTGKMYVKSNALGQTFDVRMVRLAISHRFLIIPCLSIGLTLVFLHTCTI
jgi:hypothetical protein